MVVRYKVYPEKNRKPKIKYCIGFDPEHPAPEREWEQMRADGDAEAAVREAVRKECGASEPAAVASMSNKALGSLLRSMHLIHARLCKV